MAKSMKRIHKVTIKRMTDESPDTSWLGEYSNTAETEYAIRSSMVPSNNVEAIRKLQSVLSYYVGQWSSTELSMAQHHVEDAILMLWNDPSTDRREYWQ